MRLISWNINGRRGAGLARQVSALERRVPELVALQEVRLETVQRWRTALQVAGLVHVRDSADGLKVPGPAGRDYRRRYFNLLASRWSLERMPGLDIAFPERYLAAKVELSRAVEIHVAHVPPGASRGLIKIEMLEALWDRLARPAEAPRILCGDFNTPRTEAIDGTVEFWGARRGPHRQRWDAAERSVILGLAEHDLADVFRTLNGYAARDASWLRTQGSSVMRRRYDHVFAAESLFAKGCRYHHTWREDGLSDHAPIEVDFDYETD